MTDDDGALLFALLAVLIIVAVIENGGIRFWLW